LNSTVGNESVQESRNGNCALVDKSVTLGIDIVKSTMLPHRNFHTYILTTLYIMILIVEREREREREKEREREREMTFNCT
jgi:hypothetical protein